MKHTTAKQRAAIAKRARALTKAVRLKAWDSWVSADGQKQLEFTTSTGIPLSYKELEVVKSLVRPWQITIMLKARDEYGAEYLEEHSFDTPPIRINEIGDSFNEIKAGIVEELEPGHTLIDVGWKARPLR